MREIASKHKGNIESIDMMHAIGRILPSMDGRNSRRTL